MQTKWALVCTSLFFFFTSTAQWKEVSADALRTIAGERKIVPDAYRVFRVTERELLTSLQKAPKEFARSTPVVLTVPMPDGTIQRFSIFDSPIMEKGLQQKFPELKTYSGQGMDDPYASIRIDMNPYTGFSARILSPGGDVFIDPYVWGNRTLVQSYYQRHFRQSDPFTEKVLKLNVTTQTGTRARSSASAPCRGNQLFTYRIAVSCTGEYAAAATGKSTPTKAETLAAIVKTLNRVNQVYERDLAVRLNLVANNDLLVYTDTASDPYDGNDEASVLLEESRANIPAVIGNASFDIGHTFSTGAGGIAYLGVVCVNEFKAGGVTGRLSPVGDPYDIDYVAHEIGHQFGGNHTFRGTNGSCSGNGNYGEAPLGSFTAYEPGSGTTIMGYAGICLTDDLQPNSDPYFHAISFDEIINYITSGSGGCKGVVNTGNSIPVITAMQGNGASIPVGTPFTLSATATDANGDGLTYSWEQWDVGLAPSPYNNVDGYSDGDAIWRSRVPTTDGKRTIPDLRYIVSNFPANPSAQMNGLKGEVLPTKLRTYSFKLTVRDNRAGGGGVASGGGKPVNDVTGAGGVGCSMAGPFSIAVVPGVFRLAWPNGGETLIGGTTETITWVNSATTAAPINCQTVHISLSTDGGLTYPVTLAASTPNDGSQPVLLPNLPHTTAARIRVEAADNIFFDISNANFTLLNSATLPVGLQEFTVKAQGRNGAALAWRTVLEEDNSGFEIQRSVGSAAAFEAIAFRPGNNSGNGGAYAFLDENLPVNELIYYRLRQIDRSGQSRYSDVRTIRLNGKSISLALQPNPARSFVNVINNGEAIQKAVVEVLDANGRLVLFQQKMLGSTTRIELATLARGVYTIRIINGGDILFATKFLKE